LSTLPSACKFGCCVVALQPNAQIFLLLGRGLFYADVSVLLDTFSHNNLCIREHAFLPSWRLQLDNIGGIDSLYSITCNNSGLNYATIAPFSGNLSIFQKTKK